MSNRKRILKGKYDGALLLLLLALPPLRHQLNNAISSKDSLEYVRARPPRLRHRLPTVGVEHNNEHPTRTFGTVHLVASDRTTSLAL